LELLFRLVFKYRSCYSVLFIAPSYEARSTRNIAA
jgi:hypothetical protein